MRVFVAGASGFIGQHTMATLETMGHVAVPLGRRDPKGNGWSRVDLCSVEDYLVDLSTCDAVINMAGGRDDHAVGEGDESPTGCLLKAMAEARVTRLIHISSFAVYDYRSAQCGDVIDENSPIEHSPARRDQYTRSKLHEEALVLSAEVEPTILRLGAVYGPGRHWNGGMAATRFGVGLAIGSSTRQKLVSVQSAADAIVASLVPEAIGQTLNIIDSNLPDQRGYANMLRSAGVDLPRSVRISFRAADALAVAAEFVTRPAPRLRVRLPEVLSRSRLAARHKPLEYSNRRAHELLDWNPVLGCDVATIGTTATPRKTQ